MVNLRTFQISGKYFWGFKRTIDLDYFDNSQDIIKKIKEEIKIYLKKENLEILVDKLNEKKYHIMDIGKILVETKPLSTIFICDHCHKNCCN